jgi:hypothetical protein
MRLRRRVNAQAAVKHKENEAVGSQHGGILSSEGIAGRIPDDQANGRGGFLREEKK